MTSTCPNADVLRGLLDSSLPEPVQAEVVAHLDACSSCQVKLEQLAASGSAILEVARSARGEDAPEETSAFWPALRRVEREIRNPVDALAVTRSDPDVSVRSVPEFEFLDPPDDPAHLGSIDRFQMVELVGRGGMGMVFRAHDACLQRTVAVKVLDPQYAKNELARERFLREARAAAGVAHENVVTIHHVDCVHDKGLSFMVMQFIRGKSLQERLDAGGPLPVREAVRIAAAVAGGLAAAHANGLIHRDIKPGNILIEQPSGRVLLTDFGLARLTEDVKLTQTGFVAGTPLYMSPEQARGETVDHRSDQFSLGSVLYAMLTGVPPFPGTSPFTVLKQVTDRRPRPVQDFNPAVPNSLAEVLDRLMEKDPRARYADAAEAAAALNAELAKLPPDPPQPVTVRRSSRSVPRVVRTWWRRNSPLLLAGVAAALVLAFAAEATGLTAWTVLGQRGRPSVRADAGEGETPARYTLPPGEGAVWAVAFDPRGGLIATANEGGAVKFWDVHDGQIRGVLNNRKYKAPVWSVAFSPDGTRLFTASDDGFVRQWDLKTRQEIGEGFRHPFAVRSLALSPNGRLLATGTRNGLVTIWDVENRTERRTAGHDGGNVMSIAFSPDGRFVASAGSDQTVRLWNATDGTETAVLGGHSGPVYTVAFDPTSHQVASAGWDRLIRLWDVNTSQLLKTIEGSQEDIWSIAFCPAGKHLLAGGQDRTTRWFDVETGTVLKTYRGHGGPVHAVATSKDGKLIAAGGRDGTVRVWDVEATGD
jgi:WD40 repeat protein/predicted Ser/Thr protein kinase